MGGLAEGDSQEGDGSLTPPCPVAFSGLSFMRLSHRKSDEISYKIEKDRRNLLSLPIIFSVFMICPAEQTENLPLLYQLSVGDSATASPSVAASPAASDRPSVSASCG